MKKGDGWSVPQDCMLPVMTPYVGCLMLASISTSKQGKPDSRGILEHIKSCCC